MIDMNVRRRASILVAQLRDGVISNFDFEDRWPPKEKSDRGLRAIRSMLWRSYDDNHEHRLVGEYALSGDERAIFDRCILFLNSDLDYRWPVDDFFPKHSSSSSATLLTDLRVTGADAIWPFFDEPEYNSRSRESTE
jgi:hypothetical protein